MSSEKNPKQNNEQHIYNNSANFFMETLEVLSMFMDKEYFYDYCADCDCMVSNSCEQCHSQRERNHLWSHSRGMLYLSVSFFLKYKPFSTQSLAKDCQWCWVEIPCVNKKSDKE